MAIAGQEGLPDTGDKHDSFVVDIERLSHITDKDIPPNSRITRSFSRKGSLKGERKNSATTVTSHDKVTDTAAAIGNASFKGGGGGGFSTVEKSITVPLMGNPAPDVMNKQAQVMMMMMMSSSSDGRCISRSISGRRQGGKRPILASLFGPRTVLVFFSTLSSMGTILLIYFTLCMGRLGEDELSQAQLQ